MATGYRLSDGRDFSDVFFSGSTSYTTSYRNSSGVDLGKLFVSGSSGVVTKYRDASGVDLGSLFGIASVWENPAITNNGTLGGGSFAVTCTGDYAPTNSGGNGGIYRAFDKSTSTAYFNRCGSAASTDYLTITMYNPQPVRLTSIAITNSYYGFKTAILQFSDTNSGYVDLQNIAGPLQGETDTTTTNTISYEGFHKYWKMRAIGIGNNSGGWRNVNIREIVLKGYVIK